MTPVIEVKNLSKKFRRGEDYDSLREEIPALFARLLRSRPRDAERLERNEFWALRHVSFDVMPGTAVGVIGHNGAGKSTLLKHLTGLLRPTSGTICAHRRVSALIEVGAGFHGDLTGRENIFLNGSLLGMSVLEIRKKFDQIVDFSGLERFLDTPVKRYSSGMFAKLGFSVAAHLDPEILLIDEVLSVGDQAFQKKCVEKMRGIVADGATVIFVSHNLRSVLDLCERCLVMHHGELAADGDTTAAIHRYMELASRTQACDTAEAIVFDEVQIISGQQNASVVRSGERFTVRVRGHSVRALRNLDITLVWSDASQQQIAMAQLSQFGASLLNLSEGQSFEIETSFVAPLASGSYDLAVVGWLADAERTVDVLQQAATLQIDAPEQCHGLVNMQPRVVSQSLGEVELLSQSGTAI